MTDRGGKLLGGCAMPKRAKMCIVSTMLCTLVVLGFSSCGASTPAGRNSPELTVMFSKHAAPATLANDLRNAQAITRLYQAALALPPLRNGTLNCPADDGGIYHLTFLGDKFTVRHMDVKASGCSFLTLTDTGQVRWMDDAFISLFTATVGLQSLDPTYP
jgi:hypothetical protein